MICRPCAEAADGTPEAQHCGQPDERTPHCTCQHRSPAPMASAPKESA